MKPLPQSTASTPMQATGKRDQLIASGFSINALAVTVTDPSTVPRMVCGRRNFQKADRKSDSFSCSVDGVGALASPADVAHSATLNTVLQARRSGSLSTHPCALCVSPGVEIVLLINRRRHCSAETRPALERDGSGFTAGATVHRRTPSGHARVDILLPLCNFDDDQRNLFPLNARCLDLYISPLSLHNGGGLEKSKPWGACFSARHHSRQTDPACAGGIA